MPTTVQTHDNHPVDDYIADGELKPECVRVRLTRAARPTKPSLLKFFTVEISVLDRSYTFADRVADAMGAAGFKVWTDGRHGEGIMVAIKPPYRAPRGFVAVYDL